MLPTRFHRIHLTGLTALSLATASLTGQSILSQHGEVVLACGDPVADVPGATIYSTSHLLAFHPAAMDRNGTILVRARMNDGPGGVDSTNRHAYFLGRTSADLHMVVRMGDQAPGCPSGTLLRRSDVSSIFNGLSDYPLLSPEGELLFFRSDIYDPVTPANTPTSSDTALFWGPAGGLQLLAREGEPVPFLGGGVTWGDFPSMGMPLKNTRMGSNGRVLFTSSLIGASAATNQVIVTGSYGALQKVAQKGDVLPGGGTLIAVSGFDPFNNTGQINDAGQVLFDARFATGGGITTANDYALVVWTNGSTQIIAREGNQAPGLPAGVVFAGGGSGATEFQPFTVNSNVFNSAGSTLLDCHLDGTGVVASVNDEALYFGGSGGLTLVLRRGDAVPGLPGVTWGNARGDIGASASLTNGGRMAFVGRLAGAGVTSANDRSIWTGTVGNLTMIAREGDLVPGMVPSGNGPWSYGAMDFSKTRNPYINERGVVLFQNDVSDGVVNKDMWFVYTPQHGVRILLDGGDTFTTSFGTAGWTIADTFGAPGSGDGSPAWFNNNGDFVCKLVLGAPANGAIVRGHVGSLIGTPGAVPVAGGVPHSLFLDVGPAYANQFYIVLASGLGTRPGFPHPLNFAVNVPLTFDPVWTNVSWAFVNTPSWTNTLGVTDASGKPLGGLPISFNMPVGFPEFLGYTVHHAAMLFDGALVGTHATEPVAVKLF
jgi:hypothetical protein